MSPNLPLFRVEVGLDLPNYSMACIATSLTIIIREPLSNPAVSSAEPTRGPCVYYCYIQCPTKWQQVWGNCIPSGTVHQAMPTEARGLYCGLLLLYLSCGND